MMPLASRSSDAPCCGVVTGMPLTAWMTSPTRSFLERAMRYPAWICATTTPLRLSSAGTSNVMPRIASLSSFHRSISLGPAGLPCRKDDSARPKVLTERPVISLSSSSSISSSTASPAPLAFFLPALPRKPLPPAIVRVRPAGARSGTTSASSSAPPEDERDERFCGAASSKPRLTSPTYLVSPLPPCDACASSTLLCRLSELRRA
mmetsp:Transcript_46955/g.123744  ORF Transcript_46955/g.123744 Transcript_46955/m.123744 type:complete len:206 (-) Transcript_46955:21-638(-)